MPKVGHRRVVLLDASRARRNTTGDRRACDIEGINPHPRSIRALTAFVRDLDRERVQSRRKTACLEQHSLILRHGVVRVDHLHRPIEIDRRQTCVRVSDANPRDAGAVERDRSARPFRVRQHSLAAGIRGGIVRIPVAAVDDRWVVLFDPCLCERRL